MLRRSMNVDFKDINAYIYTAVLLHNFCEYRSDSWEEQFAEDLGSEVIQQNRVDELGVVTRERIASELMNRY